MISGYLYIIPASYGLFGAMFAVNATFNAADHPLRAAFVIVVRLFVLAIPLALAGSALGGLPGLFTGIAAANMIVGILAILMARHYLRGVEERIVSVGNGGSDRHS